MVYEPKIAIHPGRHIARLLDELGVNQSWLSERAGVSRKLISQVINGEALVSPDLAVSLENVFGVSAEFWSNLNSNYLTAKSKIDRVEKAKEEVKHRESLRDKSEVSKVAPKRKKENKEINR